MKSTRYPARRLGLALAGAAAIAMAHLAAAAPRHCFFECSSGGVPDKLLWQTETGTSYDLWFTEDLAVPFTHVAGFPQDGDGGVMEHPFTAGTRGFFQIIPAPDGFALIPAGSFLMGDQSNPLVGYEQASRRSA